MTLPDLRDLLMTVGAPVHHYHPGNQSGNYIVWAEEGEGGSEHADDQKTSQSLQGTIDYFTKTEFDPVVKQIQAALNSAEITWRLNSTQYERDTGYTHFEWTWEMIDDG